MRNKLLLSVVAGAGLALYARLHSAPAPQPLPTSTALQPRPALGTLEVLSLNVGHGRGKARSQWRVDTPGHLRNLHTVARLLEREAVDVIALQEVDGPSWWSGRFDHLGQIRTALGSPAAAHGIHAGTGGLQYGTALLGSDVLSDVVSHAFGANGPTPRKGFTIATTTLDGVELDVVSVHLDFALATVRERQLEEIAATLAERGRPTILLGDFNMEPSEIQVFLDQNGLSTLPQDVTFPGTGGRLDYVVVTGELELLELRVLPDHVSDHRAVRATIRWAERTSS